MKILLGVLGALLAMQLVRPERSNPAVTGDIAAPEQVAPILKKACYDCHSNETKWPWYTNVAPVSWFVTHHVNEGREELNFSEWAGYPEKKKAHKLEEIEEQVREGEMPMGSYLRLHPDAALSDAEKKTLQDWAKPGA